jgi:hypothetical protein
METGPIQKKIDPLFVEGKSKGEVGSTYRQSQSQAGVGTAMPEMRVVESAVRPGLLMPQETPETQGPRANPPGDVPEYKAPPTNLPESISVSEIVASSLRRSQMGD